MDVLGIGFWELIVIFVVAMMVFGPRRLPEIAGKAGKIVRDLRNMSQGLMAEWQREITVAARMEELQKVRQELEEAKQEITQAHQEIGQTQRDVSKQTQENLQQIQQNLTATPTTTTNSKPAQAESETGPESSVDSPQPPQTAIDQPQVIESPVSPADKKSEQAAATSELAEPPQVSEPNTNSAPPIETDGKSPASVKPSPSVIPPTPKEMLNE